MPHKNFLRALLASGGLATVLAQSDTASFELPAATLHGDLPFSAASSQTVRDRDLKQRPILKPADLIKVTPGLFVGQHAGGGKANQYFLRGFDIDHGTDLALWVDGLPVNMVSHAHGQGYADLHFIIPELYDRVEVTKGPYSAELGDFATAGSVRMRSRRAFESFTEVSGGVFNTWRFLGVFQEDNDPSKPVYAAEVYRDDGPFDRPEGLERYNLFYRNPLVGSSKGGIDLTLMSYGSGWNGSGQVPLRAVEAGTLSRFGSIDPSEGGQSQRHSAELRWRGASGDGRSEWEASAYLLRYQLSLFSNFTFFAGDSVRGDGINQRDARLVSGFDAHHRFYREAWGVRWNTLAGIQMRHDRAETALDRAQQRRLTAQVVDATVDEGSLGLYLQEEIIPSPYVRLVLGLRSDHFGFDVEDHLNAPDTAGPKTSGVRDASILSPKANLIVSPLGGRRGAVLDALEIYLNYGEGFHSNDARGVVRDTGATPLAKARGYEAGVRAGFFDRLELAAAAWRLDLRSELVWVGDEGTTEARGATERQGIDLEARLRLLSWLWADADVNLARAVYAGNAGNANAVALAPTRTISAGLSADHRSGARAAVRLEHIGDRPASEDRGFTAEGFTVIDVSLGYRYRRIEVFANVFNLLNTGWREAQFVNESRLAGEPGPVEDIHFVPGTPFQVQGGLKVFF
jgi:outer membrane receptor protein involved in Fe transport